MNADAAVTAPWFTSRFIVPLASAVLGMFGTWLISRRYARQFFRSLFYATLWPFLSVVGLGDGLRELLKNKVKANADIADSAVDMVLGMTLLFWAFFLQVAAMVLEAKKK